MSTAPHQHHRLRARKQAEPERWINRLTVFGTKRELKQFQKCQWQKSLRGRYWLLQETMLTRFGCLFETQCSPILSLEALSKRWPDLVLLLQWENETTRIIGLVRAKAGKLEQFQVGY